MNRNQKTAYVLGALILIVLIWANTPIERLPEGAWGIGFKVRLIGFVGIILLAFYFFFDKVVFKNRKGK